MNWSEARVGKCFAFAAYDVDNLRFIVKVKAQMEMIADAETEGGKD